MWHDTGSGPGAVSPEPAKLIGRTLALAEDEYKFGTGTLTLRITAVLVEQEYPDGRWLYVKGEELTSDGRVRQIRQVLIRPDRTHG